MKISKSIAITTSVCAILLTGCGAEQEQAKNQTTPQAAPAKQVQQVQQPQQDKVISKGKIVGKTEVLGRGIVDVEERTVETVDVYGKPKTEKRYYIAGTSSRIHYDPNEKDVTIKNKGQQVDDVKVK